MERYSRHTVLKDIGEPGQALIGKGNVVIIGLGGLGSTMADALVRCGVGNMCSMEGVKKEGLHGIKFREVSKSPISILLEFFQNSCTRRKTIQFFCRG